MSDEQNVNIILKLFDTLKSAIDKVDDTCQDVRENQNEMRHDIEKISIKDLNQALKDHNKDSKEEIDACTLKVEETNNNINKQLLDIRSKITKMIVVVITAFSLFTVAIFIANFVYKTSEINKSDENRLERLIKDQQKSIDYIQGTIKGLYEEKNVVDEDNADKNEK